MKGIKKISLAVIISSGVTSLLIAAPSYGISLDLNTFLAEIRSQIQSEMSQISSIASDKINNFWAAAQEDANSAINGATGVMGAPDPVESGQRLKVSLASGSDWATALTQAQDLQREITKASVSGVLGQLGQQDTANKIDQTTQTAQDASNLGQEAQEMNASQNILKVIAAQNSLVVSMLAQQRTDSLQSRSDTAQSNMMLTQIAEKLTANRQKEDIREEGLISLNLEVAAMSVLDPTYSP
ncbi:hypothetical protein LC608_35560 [Nostoc sp. XA010]|uniref:hypothetical protein n=1 Tax=Nostoc sp. XA010 TaxID=2780407 RepID=UPI0019E4FED5|nr:hypothetical protein [Nostoc sp. XA010]MBE8968051.1 hypothetical protein [Nostocales cyanobacterium LEGE 12452]MCC5662135.1 hypothetical protein [Nostoc sp. XA010]